MWKVITEALRAVLGPKAAEKLFKWVVGIYLKQKSGPTPSQVREHDPDAYAQMVSLMHEEMWKWTLDKKNGYELIVMGHTHFDELRHKALCNKTYVNCGAFDGFGNTCVEVTGEGPELLKW
jgi:UDP-2,3-diacylglucosamine pyrophosphatase LpxH